MMNIFKSVIFVSTLFLNGCASYTLINPDNSYFFDVTPRIILYEEKYYIHWTYHGNDQESRLLNCYMHINIGTQNNDSLILSIRKSEIFDEKGDKEYLKEITQKNRIKLIKSGHFFWKTGFNTVVQASVQEISEAEFTRIEYSELFKKNNRISY